jgi:hypothetical protein
MNACGDGHARRSCEVWSVMDPSSDEQLNPFGLLLRSLQAALGAADPAGARAPESDAMRLLRQWLAALGGPWSGATASSPLNDLWARMVGAPGATGDLIDLWARWYAANSDALARALDEVLRSPAFVRASARTLDDYAAAVATQRRAAEVAARSLPFATHADITRLARLVIATEEKVDRLLELGQAVERRDQGDLASDVAALVGRLDRIEAKVDRLVAVREGGARSPRAAAARRRPSASGATVVEASTEPSARATGRQRAKSGASGPPVRLVRGAKVR